MDKNILNEWYLWEGTFLSKTNGEIRGDVKVLLPFEPEITRPIKKTSTKAIVRFKGSHRTGESYAVEAIPRSRKHTRGTYEVNIAMLGSTAEISVHGNYVQEGHIKATYTFRSIDNGEIELFRTPSRGLKSISSRQVGIICCIQ